MAEYLPFSTQEQSYAAGGVDPNKPVTSAFDFASSLAQMGQRQQQHEQLVAEAAERIKQARMKTKGQEELVAGGVNLSGEDQLPIQDAIAFLHANGLKQEVIDEFTKSLGNAKYVDGKLLRAFIAKRSGSQLNIGVQKAYTAEPIRGENGKYVLTWKRTYADPDTGLPKIEFTTKSVDNTPVFKRDDPEGYANGEEIESIQGEKLDVSKMTGEARKTMASQKTLMNKITSWEKLVNSSNPLNQKGLSALAMAGKANQSADRAMGFLKKDPQTLQNLKSIELDVSRILTGGVPTMLTQDEQRIFDPGRELLMNILEMVTGARAEGVVTRKLEQQLFEAVKHLKDVDNEIIEKQLKTAELQYKDIIDTDKPRWEEIKQTIRDTMTSKNETDAYNKLYGTGSATAPAASPAEPSSAAKPHTVSSAHEDKKAALKAKIAAMGK